jgi:acyl-CoA oxidase
MLNLANAFIERVVLEQFTTAIQGVPDTALAQVLKRLANVYALSTIESHKGWFLEQEYLAPVKSKAIRRHVDKLCGELRKDALALVNAFDIPDELLAAEIVVASSK